MANQEEGNSRLGDSFWSESTECPALGEIELPELTPDELEAFVEGAQLIEKVRNTPLSQYTTELHFCDAPKLFEFFLRGLTERDWAFRGQADASWALRPSAERLARELGASSVDPYILAAFKRRAHQYLRDLPSVNDTLEWLALAQHYGAPTSLLDFSASPYVATFFAVTEQVEGKPAVIWAIDIGVLKSEARQRLEEIDESFKTINVPFGSPEIFNKLFPDCSRRGTVILPLQPVRMNERLTIQQGLFLYPSSRWDFETTLKLMLDSLCDRDDLGDASPNFLYKLVIEPDAKLGVLKELHRMNVTHASLFPGLEGFARSLGTTALIRDREGFKFFGTEFDGQV